MCEDEKKRENKLLFDEYKLAIETQMHFNELLMKLRTFGMMGVLAILGFAITRCAQQQQARGVAVCGILLLVALALLDMLYFFQLLLGAVDRSSEIEHNVSHLGLTGAIKKRVTTGRAWSVLFTFYAIALVAGLLIIASTF